MTRSAHLVGSIPADDAEQAMRMALQAAPGRLRSLPDGETGERHHWIIHIIDALERHPDLELKKAGGWTDYDDTPVLRIRRGHTLRGETLDFGHVAAFAESYPVFRRLREEAGAGDLAFQVGVPGDLDMALFALGPLGAFRHRAAFRTATVAEIRAVHAQAQEDVLFQIEVPAELVFVARMPSALQPLMARLLGRGVARLAAESPASARFGIHLCLGDMNHRALGRMKDSGPVVHLANAIARAWPAGRPLEFMHAPFAAAQEPPPTDPAWYAPLARLRLPPGTRVIAGIAHEGQELEEQRRLRTLIEGLVGHEVDVATSCGLGRRERPAAAAALERTAALAD